MFTIHQILSSSSPASTPISKPMTGRRPRVTAGSEARGWQQSPRPRLCRTDTRRRVRITAPPIHGAPRQHLVHGKMPTHCIVYRWSSSIIY
jgi:hypothetical protein